MKKLRLSQNVKINLQLFNSQEKTEKATAKKRQKAREKGQVLKSQEFNSALVLLVAFFAIKIFFPYMMSQLDAFFKEIYGMWGSKDFTLNTQLAHRLYMSVADVGIRTVVPIAGLTLISGVAANLLQTGFMFSTETMKPSLNNINPISGMKNIFSLKSLVELFKNIIKIVIIGAVAYSVYKDNFNSFPYLLDMNIQASSLLIGKLMLEMAFKIGFCLLILAGFDYLYQKWEYERKLKMSKQEVKDERKQSDGNPEIKSAIKRKQRQMSMSRMMQSVPQADVVITNPTHYAVALKYDGSTMSAPEVIAKGQDFLAQKIKEIARENDVVMVENKPLAQALYKSVEIGEVVPPDLYQAVAEVMAFVYKLKGKI